MEDAVVAVIRRGARVLVVRRGPATAFSGYWAPLSGRLEPGESQAAAVVREVREEVGLTARAGRKVWECPTDDARYRLHWWTVEILGGELRPDRAEVSEVRWVSADEYLELEPTFVGDAPFFRDVLPTLASEAPGPERSAESG